MWVFENAEELLALSSGPLGHSDWLTIDQDRVDLFAACTGDTQWIHVDQERAARTPLGTTIVHGYLLLSLLPLLSSQIYDVQGCAQTVNYGLNRVRFTDVVPVGERVRLRVSLVSAERRPQGVQVLASHLLERGGRERPALIAEQIRLFVA